MGPVFIISQGQFEEPVRPWKSSGGVQGQSPGRGSGGRSLPEVEAKCEMSLRFLRF